MASRIRWLPHASSREGFTARQARQSWNDSRRSDACTAVGFASSREGFTARQARESWSDLRRSDACTAALRSLWRCAHAAWQLAWLRRRERFAWQPAISLFGVCVVVVTAACGCDTRRDSHKEHKDAPTSSASVAPEVFANDNAAPPPQLLYLPDGGDVALGSELVPGPASTPAAAPPASGSRCPPEMVFVAGVFCIDRYEASLVDGRTSEELSPYYPPDATRAKQVYAHWAKERSRTDTALGQSTPLPELPEAQLDPALEAMAVSKPNVVPQGYLDANTAARACERAGKRLCSATEWVTACRGQQNRQFPYGAAYVHGACNVFRDAHPAYLLHGNPSEGHHDPRLNLVEADGGPLLRKTGATPRCRSEWGNDAIYDMVGNLDEWVDDEQGAFHGGFFSRSTRLGCDARISSHPRQYSDYSLGVRCCK